MQGFDYDGTIFNPDTEDLLIRPPPDAIIITGRTASYALETLDWLHAYRISNPISFNPGNPEETDKERDSATHKARIIRTFKIQIFWENDVYQARIIKNLVPEVQIILVKNGKIKSRDFKD